MNSRGHKIHKDVELEHPHVAKAKLYVEGGGKWVLHVSANLCARDTEALGLLEHTLEDMIGRHTGYTSYEVYVKKAA